MKSNRHLWRLLLPLAAVLVCGCQPAPEPQVSQYDIATELHELNATLASIDASQKKIADHRILPIVKGDWNSDDPADWPTPGPAIDFRICTCPICGCKHHHGQPLKAAAPDLRAALHDAFNLIIHLGHTKEEITQFVQDRFSAIYDKRVILPPLTKKAVLESFKADIAEDINSLSQ